MSESAVVITKKILANEGSTSSHRMLLIHEVEIAKIDPTKKSRFRVKITAGNEKPTETEEFIIDRVGVTPKWAITKSLGLDPLTKILWELHGRRWPVSRFKVVGSVEKTLGELFELFEGNNTSADIHLSNGSSDVAVLKISVQLDTPKNVMTHLVPSVKKPSESSELLDSETLQKAFEVVKQMIDTLAEVHPAATIAWGFLSIGFEVVKKQRDTKDAIRELYKVMISVYEAFSKDDILEQRDRLKGIYSSLFKQTMECAMFIEGYAKKTEIEKIFTMDISVQAENFHQAFTDLKGQLSMGLAKEAVIVTLGVQKSVDDLVMRELLRKLEPPEELGPKSRCMQGTRVETIKEMVSWIAQCNRMTMWCRGLAGTGKSSLMGTLHDLLTTDIGGRSRLAAFVRYDRIEYSKASKLITSIAYALGMFDDRIGRAISLVVQTLPSVVTLSPSLQFQRLLRNPLESIPDLVDGGPLVVVIDGLDECDVSSDMLAVLAEGFGPKLSFMRLILSSRPVHHMAKAFEGRDRIYPLYLDTSLESVNRDIQFYLERELAIIHDDAFQKKCKELDAVNELTARASGLFIWAAIVARFVHAFPGISRLHALLDTKIPSDATEALTTLYRTALDTLVSEPGTNVDIKKYVRSVLGAVLVTQTPPGMTEGVLDHVVLLGEGSPPSRHIVSMLGSVLSPETEDSPIRLIHKSLNDFLQDRSRCGDEWFIDVTLHCKAIAEQCRVASKSFMKLWSPKSDMKIGVIPAYISKYALFGVFWYSVSDKSDLELFTSFFCHYFLPWLDIVAMDDNIIHFEVMDTFCRQQGLTHLSIQVNIHDLVKFHNVLKTSTHFYYHLHQSSQESPFAGKITLECMDPTGNNLNINGMIVVHEGIKYVFKISNITLMHLYVSVFFFDASDLDILSYYQQRKAVGAPLPPGESLTTGQHSYYVPGEQEVDVGFLKLFFSTEYLDLSVIPRIAGSGSVPPPVGKMPSLCHTMCVPIVQKRGRGARLI
ncbi:uncharacterized protein ARMOST_04282 [Armillaria ostoyae]|uniref:Nephrocystin 3-like N-terminal domain-containing protein n=1 Tax=Armillaria ostoyae TaxID=47428 RepID=A0A284QWX3_ARMOS|nr:uncharacterized protein ARMOST_04282 [Armillaria ostoyae]